MVPWAALAAVLLAVAAFVRRNERRHKRHLEVLRRLAALRLEAQTNERLVWDRRRYWI